VRISIYIFTLINPILVGDLRIGKIIYFEDYDRYWPFSFFNRMLSVYPVSFSHCTSSDYSYGGGVGGGGGGGEVRERGGGGRIGPRQGSLDENYWPSKTSLFKFFQFPNCLLAPPITYITYAWNIFHCKKLRASPIFKCEEKRA